MRASSTLNRFGTLRFVVFGFHFKTALFMFTDDLKPITESGLSSNPHYLKYIAAAARVAEAMANDVLVAPIESSVIPLPHQINVLSRALSGERIRYLLADEVGLGKTIEAGLIFVS